MLTAPARPLSALALAVSLCACATWRSKPWRCSPDGLGPGAALCATGSIEAGGSPNLRCSGAEADARSAVGHGMVDLVLRAVDRSAGRLGGAAAQIRSRVEEARGSGIVLQGSYVAQRRDSPGSASCRAVVVLPPDALRASARTLLAEAGVTGAQADAILDRLE